MVLDKGEYWVHTCLLYIDDLSSELNNIKAGCVVGDVLLNHLMSADDTCVFCPSVWGLQSILDVCQAYAEWHGQVQQNCLYDI